MHPGQFYDIDVLFVRSIINTHLKVLVKKEILKIPMLGYLAKHTAILVNRSDKTDRKKGMVEKECILLNG